MAKVNRTLMEIGDDLHALEVLLYEVGGDVTEEEAAEAVDGWLEENRHNLKEKLKGYVALIREADNNAQFRRDEAKRLVDLAQQDEGFMARMKNRLLWFFQAHEIDRIDIGTAKIAVAGNGGKTPMLIDPTASAEASRGAYPQYVRVRYEWDTEAIRNDLEQGKPVPFASLGERGKHIRIR
jgi:hypothetical protein